MTYQQINSSALEILSLMASEAEFGKVTISSTAVGNAIGVKRETARRNIRSLVDMNLPEDRVSGRPFDKPTEWRVDSDVECDEWIPGPTAGGGLFLYATLTHAVTAVAKDEVIMEVTADPTDVFSVGDGVVKARRVHVVEDLRWKW